MPENKELVIHCRVNFPRAPLQFHIAQNLEGQWYWNSEYVFQTSGSRLKFNPSEYAAAQSSISEGRGLFATAGAALESALDCLDEDAAIRYYLK